MPNLERERDFLSLLEKAINIEFTNVTPRDKPDFLVNYQNQQLGIEITEGSSEEMCRALALNKKLKLPFYSLSGFEDRDKSTKRANLELQNILKSGDYENSEDAAILWAERIASRIQTKVALMLAGEIKRFATNWLCIVNLQPDDWALETEFYRAVLLGALGSDKRWRTTFDAIYVVSYDHLFVISRSHVIAKRREPTG